MEPADAAHYRDSLGSCVRFLPSIRVYTACEAYKSQPATYAPALAMFMSVVHVNNKWWAGPGWVVTPFHVSDVLERQRFAEVGMD